jgi:16S rRNA (guanine966-N2)-methyltransferase
LPNLQRKTVKGNVRPTSGKVLAALFNILAASGRLDGASFLDLFSGTGTVAAEALRRGAARVLAVESDRALASAILRGIAAPGAESAASGCVCADVRRAIPKLAGGAYGEYKGPFGIIFADPPYRMGWAGILPPMIAENARILARGGVFVLERSSKETPAEISAPRDDRVYGDTVLSFYWDMASAAPE